MAKRPPGPFAAPPKRVARPPFSFDLYDHDLTLIETAGQHPNAVIVYVKCPHLLGLCYLQDDGVLANLPCPCNDKSDVLGVLLHDQRVLESFGVGVGGDE